MRSKPSQLIRTIAENFDGLLIDVLSGSKIEHSLDKLANILREEGYFVAKDLDELQKLSKKHFPIPPYKGRKC